RTEQPMVLPLRIRHRLIKKKNLQRSKQRFLPSTPEDCGSLKKLIRRQKSKQPFQLYGQARL
ncbi:hypothetical protein K0U00_43515, partial [Paenibacillus sepulcri]|nr:hypothetical protein [Paenibacillus sepulcri]